MTIEIPVFIGECKDCPKHSHATLNEGYAQYWAESHAMETGHIVDITEVC